MRSIKVEDLHILTHTVDLLYQDLGYLIQALDLPKAGKGKQHVLCAIGVACRIGWHNGYGT